ncbi:MAG: histidine--tRNA ligase [Chloroflexota bacterium]
MAKANTKPLSGMRDFLPVDVLRRNYVIRVIEDVYQSYGFEPLETPVMERLDTLLGKYGEDEKLIFRVLKRGDKLQRSLSENPTEESVADAGLRYDLTVPLARVVAQYRSDLPRFFKRYQIQPVYRADRPGRGRYREFYQCDLDIVGSASRAVEAEVMAAVAQILDRLGFGDDHPFAVRLNHRMILRGLIDLAGIPESLEGSALTAIDKLDKIGIEGVSKELAQRGIDQAAADKLVQILSDAPDSGNVDTLAWLSDLLEESELGSRGVAELKEIVAYSLGGPADNHIKVDAFLARGLSYYTGAVFEIEFSGLGISGGGGGRYDELIGMFSGQDIPSCGFSLGLERIILLMEEEKMFPERLLGQPQVLVTQFDESTTNASLNLAAKLRSAGLRIDLYPEPSRYGRQFQYAEERGIPFALLLSPNEIEKQVIGVKDLQSGEQVEIPVDTVIEWLQERFL